MAVVKDKIQDDKRVKELSKELEDLKDRILFARKRVKEDTSEWKNDDILMLIDFIEGKFVER